MRLKRTLKFMIYLFCAITAIQALFLSILTPLFSNTCFEYDRPLYAILITSFSGTLPTIMFVWMEHVSKRVYYLLVGLHFVLTASLLSISLSRQGPIQPQYVTFIILLFLIIYVTAFVIFEWSHKKEIGVLNQKIRERRQR